MWVEKYRPTTLDDIVNQKEAIGSIRALLEKPAEMPHLLFSGSAGIGKTTTALCITRRILGRHYKDHTLELNASDERGISMVREKVKKFSRFASMGTVPFKIIILDEADEMTADAQTALRRIIEDTSKICRFIIIANNISKIIEPIQSRCATFKFTRISREDTIARLARIAEMEGMGTMGMTTADREGLEAVYEYAAGDLRHSINLMQTVASTGSITVESVKATAGLSKTTDVDGILDDAMAGNITGAREKMIELLRVYGMSESDFLKYLNTAVFKSKRDNLSGMLQIIAKYDYRVLVGANPEIQLAAMLAELAAL